MKNQDCDIVNENEDWEESNSAGWWEDTYGHCWSNYISFVNGVKRYEAIVKPLKKSKDIEVDLISLRRELSDEKRRYSGSLDEVLPGLDEKEEDKFWKSMEKLKAMIRKVDRLLK